MFKNIIKESEKIESLVNRVCKIKNRVYQAVFGFISATTLITLFISLFFLNETKEVFLTTLLIFALSFVFGMISSEFGHYLYNVKTKKILKENDWLKYFSRDGLYKSTELDGLLEEMQNCSALAKKDFNSFFYYDCNKKEDILEILVIKNFYQTQKENRINYLNKYIKEIRKELTEEKASSVIFDITCHYVSNMDEKTFFEEKSEIVELIKTNISTKSRKAKLVTLMEEQIEYFNEDKILESKLNKINLIQSKHLKINKKEKNEFILKSI